MMTHMRIDDRFKVLELGPWILYRPEDRAYIFIFNEANDLGLELPEGQDNHVIMENTGSLAEAIKIITEAMDERVIL